MTSVKSAVEPLESRLLLTTFAESADFSGNLGSLASTPALELGANTISGSISSGVSGGDADVFSVTLPGSTTILSISIEASNYVDNATPDGRSRFEILFFADGNTGSQTFDANGTFPLNFTLNTPSKIAFRITPGLVPSNFDVYDTFDYSVSINVSVVTAPTVTTPTSANVAATTATLGGNVTSDGGGTITERGVVYALTSANADPAIGDSGVTKVTGTGTTGVFTVNVNGLTASSGYSFKAYAINSAGTSYSSVDTFSTAAPPDTTPPTLTSFTRQTPSTSPTNADSLVFRVTFDEAVQNVTADDFSIAGTIDTVTSVASADSNAGLVYNVTVSGGDLATLNGTVSLSAAVGNNINDLANNALAATAPTTNESYTLDNLAPSVAVTPNSGVTNASPITFTFQFSETVTGFDASDVTVTNGSKGTFAAGNGDTYTLLVTPTADGTVTASVALNAAQDAAGNNNALTSGSVTSDRTAPTLTITPVSPDPRFTAVSSIGLVFSELVSGVDITDFTLTRTISGTGATSIVSLATASLSGSGSSYTIGNLSTLTNSEGTYLLSLKSSGTGINDAAENELNEAALEDWLYSSTRVTQTGDSIVIADIGGTGGTAGNTNDNIIIKRASSDPNNTNLLVTVEGKTITVPGAGVSNLVVNGGNGDDKLTLDFSNGALPFNVTYNGGAGGHDSLVIENAAAYGLINTTYTNVNDGSVRFTGSGTSRTITFTGLEPIAISGTPQAVIFNLSKANDTDVTLKAITGGLLSLSGSTFEKTDFDPTAVTSITVNLGAGNDTLTLGSLGSYTGSVSIVGGDGSDTLIVDFANGNPIPSGGLSYDGSIGSKDTLVVRNAGSQFDTTILRPLTKIGGAFEFIAGTDHSNLSYTHLGAVTIGGTESANLIFDLPNTNNGASLTDIGGADGKMRFSPDGMLGANFSVAGITNALMMHGNGGNDSLRIGSVDAALVGLVTLDGGSGNDTLNTSGMARGTSLIGGSGNDSLTGGLNNDTLDGGSGNDNLKGQNGNDLLNGGDDNDTLDGEVGNDTLNGESGNDNLKGQDGNDSLSGGDNDDVLNGGAGADILDGGSGKDTLTGGKGRDILIGGMGTDKLSGNEDDDIVIGGEVTAPATTLETVRSLWTAAGTYEARLANVSAVLISGMNVLDDSAIDTLSGNADRDLFFANLTNPNKDTILDLTALNEFVL